MYRQPAIGQPADSYLGRSNACVCGWWNKYDHLGHMMEYLTNHARPHTTDMFSKSATDFFKKALDKSKNV